MTAPTADPLFAQRALNVAAECAGSRISELTGPSRDQHLLYARWAVMVAMRSRGVPIRRIAAKLCRDHSTVITGLRASQALAERSPAFVALCAKVEAA